MTRFTQLVGPIILTVALTAVFVFGGLLVIDVGYSQDTYTTCHHPSTAYRRLDTTDPRARKPKKHTSFTWYPEPSDGNSSSIRFR